MNWKLDFRKRVDGHLPHRAWYRRKRCLLSHRSSSLKGKRIYQKGCHKQLRQHGDSIVIKISWEKENGGEHTMDHLRSHPVRVSHHGVPLPAVGLRLQTRQFTLRQLLLVLVVYHEPSQPEVRHHHSVVLHREHHHINTRLSCKYTYSTVLQKR